MMSLCRLQTVVLMFLLTLTATPTAKAQPPKNDEVAKLRAEIAQLRKDLDAAVREIRDLKAALRAGNAEPEKGPLYRGHAARYWKDQLKDADPKSRVHAVDAIGTLVGADKKLLPVLVDTLKNDSDPNVLAKVSAALAAVGVDALPSLIAIAEDKTQKLPRQFAIEAIGNMKATGKPAVPVLIKALKNADYGLLNATTRALIKIGPDSKVAVPALIDALGDTFADADKAESKGGRFGASGRSLNALIFFAVKKLDPELVGDLAPPEWRFKDMPPPMEYVQAWQRLHDTLVKRYVDRK